MDKVVAVVVTYNRKELLCECLDALLAQTLPVAKVVLVNNASTDGTEELLRTKGYLANGKIDYLPLPKNIGGAGGFYEGLKKVRDDGDFDFAWLMDDDTIPTSSASDGFVKAYAHLSEIEKDEKIGFLTGTIYDADGRINNTPGLSKNADRPWYRHLSLGYLGSCKASFVSLFVPAAAIRACGLPCRDFFIWGDDEEYTMRISRYYGEGFFVGGVKIVHKQKTTSDILITQDVNRIKMRHHGCRNGIVIWFYYGNAKDVMRFVARRLILALRCLVRRHGLLKAYTIMKGLTEGFLAVRSFKRFIATQLVLVG